MAGAIMGLKVTAHLVLVLLQVSGMIVEPFKVLV